MPTTSMAAGTGQCVLESLPIGPKFRSEAKEREEVKLAALGDAIPLFIARFASPQ